MPSPITAEQISLVLSAKLAKIKIADGYETDIGERVRRGRRQINTETDVPCVTVVELDDRITSHDAPSKAIPKQATLAQHYVLEAYSFTDDVDNPNDLCHAMLRDMKRVVFEQDEDFRRKIIALRYTGRLIGTRPDGENICWVILEIDVEFLETLNDS